MNRQSNRLFNHCEIGEVCHQCSFPFINHVFSRARPTSKPRSLQPSWSRTGLQGLLLGTLRWPCGFLLIAESYSQITENSVPPTLLATLITAQHARPFQPLPMLFPPILLFSSYLNLSDYKTDAAGITAAWSGLYALLAIRRSQVSSLLCFEFKMSTSTDMIIGN